MCMHALLSCSYHIVRANNKLISSATFDPSGTSLEGFSQRGLSSGDHQLIIRPVPNPLCIRHIMLRVNFKIM